MFVLGESDGIGELGGALMSALRVVLEEEMYFLGSIRGDGEVFEEGHSRVNPAGD